MAIITSTFGTTSISKLIRDVDSDTTPETNINGGAGVIQQIFIDNTGNTGDPFYLHLWNQTGAPTFGTTKPTMVLYCPAGKSKHYIFAADLNFATGICIAGSKNIAGVASFTPVNPTSNVAIAIWLSS
jgi:hypothetical protein